jgi:hypothetical protein
MYDQNGSPYRHVLGPAQDSGRLQPAYQPVSCDFTDQLEDISVRKQLVDVAHWDTAGKLVRSNGRIVDIFTSAEKAEYLKLDDGTTVRLDRIFEVKSPRFREDRPA